MTTPVYELYRINCINLVESFIVKFSDEAYCNNKVIINAGELVEKDPTTWRYYLNLNGEYHYSNLVMEIFSLDTLETIKLDKDILKLHPKTFAAIKPGKRLHLELVKKYPTQLVLINGLTNPVDPSISIPATDGTILAYDKTLVEEQEHTLISTLNNKSIAIFGRWHIDTHLSIGVLYSTSFLVNYAKAMIDEVMVTRKELIRTNETHSYHIWRHLASNGRLERFRPYLNNKQVLWLYREIDHLVNNAGFSETLDALIENLLTAIGIRVYELSMSQDTLGINALELQRHPVNYKLEDHSDMVTLTPLYLNTVLAEDVGSDPLLISEQTDELEAKASAMLSTNLPTKVLETFIPASISPVLDVEITHLLRQWGYWALTGRYIRTAEIMEHKSGTNLKLDNKTAYRLYLALIKIANYIPLGEYGEFGLPRIITSYRPIGGSPHIDSNLIEALYDDIAPPSLIVNEKEFYTAAIKQRDALNLFDLVGQQETSSIKEASYRSVIHACHRDVLLDLAPVGSLEIDFLNSISPELVKYGPNEAKELAIEILTQTCGLNLLSDATLSLRGEKLTDLIEELGSYHVRFISNVADTSPYNARLEVPKVNGVTSTRGYTSGFIDLASNYVTSRVIGHKTGRTSVENETIIAKRETKIKTTINPLPDQKVTAGKCVVVRYYHTTPPFVYVEE